MPDENTTTEALFAYLGSLSPTVSCIDINAVLSDADLHAHNPKYHGATPLHVAARSGNAEAVAALLQAGSQWNAVDDNGKSVGEYAKDAGHDDIYENLIQEGVRTEFLLMALGASGTHSDTEDEDDGATRSEGDETTQNSKPASKHPSNADYLSRRLTYSEGRLLDAEANAVMMGWEAPLMDLHASCIAPRPGLDVLNIGFGLGLVDEALQKLSPRTHTIIEAHPDVYAKMIKDGWNKRPGVRILFGRWQDVLDQLEAYDGIFFDTFGEVWIIHILFPLGATTTHIYFDTVLIVLR